MLNRVGKSTENFYLEKYAQKFAGKHEYGILSPGHKNIKILEVNRWTLFL